MSVERNGPQGAQLVEYTKWLEDRPSHVRSVVAKFPPWRRYRLKPTGDVVGLLSASEVLEGSEGYKQGEVVFNVKVIEMSPDRRVLRSVVGRIVTGVKPEDLVMMEPA